MHILRLRNAVFFAHHGARKEEQETGGRYEVDVSVEVDFERAARTDCLSDAVDYEQVYALIREIVLNSQCRLIERLAYLIAQRIQATYTAVEGVEVTVRKANPPLGGPTDYAEAVYRTRADRRSEKCC